MANAADVVLPYSRRGVPQAIEADRLAAALTQRIPTPRADPAGARQAALKIAREALDTARLAIRMRFEAGARGDRTARRLSAMMDGLLQGLFHFATADVYPVANPTTAERMAVLAVGGYGRGELAPHSDIDLMFLVPYKPTARQEMVIEFLLYLLWDLGLTVGHATRSETECLRLAASDHTIATTLLEMRPVAGDTALTQSLQQRFQADYLAGKGLAFIEAKLDEAEARHARLGDSRYVVEPHIKDGKGGLRDLQTLFWIAKAAYRTNAVEELVARGVLRRSEQRRFAKAHNFLLTLRCHLHYLTGRAEERLTFDVQPELARRTGYTDHAASAAVERLMKHYYFVAKDVGDLTRILCAAIEAEMARRPRLRLPSLFSRRRDLGPFLLTGERLAVAGAETFTDDPVNLIRLFQTAHEQSLDIHPEALRLVTRHLKLIDPTLRRDAEANRLLMAILTGRRNPERVLRQMNEAGVIGRFLPAFGRIVAQMQFDMYHTYTVDEHTIRALGILSRIEAGELADDHPLSNEIVHKVISRRALYVALLFHDIAKGRKGDHSVLGARILRSYAGRLGLTEEEAETARWLVRHHLAMSHTAFRRDVDDPRTISDFAELVQSPERLRLLLVLTVCDVRAVGPGVWNRWKAQLLRDLYGRIAEVLSGEPASDVRSARIEQRRQAVRALLADWSDEDVAAHAARCPPAYWLAHEPETMASHARMVRAAERDGQALSVTTRIDPGLGITELTVHAGDHPGLVSRLAGAIAVSGASVVDARIFTLSNGMALDTFRLQDANSGPFDRTDRLARLSVHIERALAGTLRPTEALAEAAPQIPTRARVFRVAPRVLIDNRASSTHTVVEVNARDRRGLLYALARALNEARVQISTAKISTFGERAVDVFYVKDVFGLKIDSDGKLAELRRLLLEAIADLPGASEPERTAVAAE